MTTTCVPQSTNQPHVRDTKIIIRNSPPRIPRPIAGRCRFWWVATSKTTFLSPPACTNQVHGIVIDDYPGQNLYRITDSTLHGNRRFYFYRPRLGSILTAFLIWWYFPHTRESGWPDQCNGGDGPNLIKCSCPYYLSHWGKNLAEEKKTFVNTWVHNICCRIPRRRLRLIRCCCEERSRNLQGRSW